MLTPDGYKLRLIDRKISFYLSVFGAVCVEGPKWCGKTWSCLNQSASVCFLGDPADNFSMLMKARINPAFVLDGDVPHLVDEWQTVPQIWDAVRFAVDKVGKKGSFF